MEKVRVIRDSSDYRYDYWLEKEIAKKFYEAGILAWDCINHCYCEIESERN